MRRSAYPIGWVVRGEDGSALLSPSARLERGCAQSGAFSRRCMRTSVSSVLCLALLAFAAYPLQAQDKPASSVMAPELNKTDVGSLSPEQVKELLRARSQTQPQQQSAKPTAETGAAKPTAEAKSAAPAEAQAAAEKAPAGQSVIELLFSGQIPGVISPLLSQFGYDVFSRPVSTFAPVTNVPVGPDYVVGPGDGFTVTMWGRVNVQYNVTVDRGGEIVLPEVGVLKVWGMTFGKLQSYLENELSRKYTDFKLAVTMDRLRSITVYVVGGAQAPSSYTISSLSAVINAIFAAGGPSKNGSLRTIQLVRQGSQPITIDLYKFLLGGDKSGDMRLQDGDTVFIPLIGPVVGVAGNVKRPAIYEMAKPMTLAEVLDLAGGVTYAGWLQRVQLERFENHRRRIVVDFDISSKADTDNQAQALHTIVQDGDLVKIFPVSGAEQNVIYLDGHVVRPGKYELKPGMRLADVLSSYDVFLPQVNMEYAEIVRLVPPDFHPVTIPIHLGRLLQGSPEQNRELARFDRIRLFRWDDKGKRSVSIEGVVYEPNEYRLIDGMRIKDLVETAGGLQKNAHVQRAELNRRYVGLDSVRTERINIDLDKALAGDAENNIVLQDYDRLVVLAVPELVFNERTVSVGGLVHKAGAYPFFEGMRVSDLLISAGGLTKNAYLRTAEITRRHIHQSGMESERIEIDLEKAVSGEAEHDIALQDYDYLIVRPVPELEFDRVATVGGEVRFPGTYPVQKGETLSSLIERAGGFTERAYFKGAIFTRESAKAVQQDRMDRLIGQLEQSMLTRAEETASAGAGADTAAEQQAALAARKELITKLRAARIDGRVVVKLAPLGQFRGSKYDLELEKNDNLSVPETPGIVTVVGEVFNPAALLYEKDRTVSYYLNRVGGPTREADRKEISIIKADGSTVSMAQRSTTNMSWDSQSHQWFFGGFSNMRLDPGDTIVVPRKMDRFMWLRTTKDITQIIFQIALTAGVVLAL